ncbi:hypothetical protein AK830_g24 [Neonectria ditissima]|uniref:Clock-controlled protein 6 n=1 Tax=Neonectria ditissima TaxID=78410 RepID=A0A0P7C398_9HYPO|nr:hypothetical protein AK830_g24 [Neonectria ditissima]
MGFTTRAAIAGLLLGVAKASPAYGNGNGNATIAYTTEVVTALTTYCPGATTLTYNDKTYTVTKATTLTITDCPCTISKPAKPTATGPAKDACAEHCYESYNECRGAKDANMATCAAKYAECLGYSPFGSDGSLVTPTACSEKPAFTKPAATKPVYTTEVLTAITTYCPEPTTLSFNNKTYTITEPTTFTITDCPCTVSKPYSPAPPKPSAPAHDCAKECTDAYNKCRGGPDANMATCAAGYAQCLGYSPFGDDGSLKTPTACSSSSVPTVPAVVPTTVYSQPTTPVATPTGGQPPVVTGAAGRIAPAGILVALGAIALFQEGV